MKYYLTYVDALDVAHETEPDYSMTQAFQVQLKLKNEGCTEVQIHEEERVR